MDETITINENRAGRDVYDILQRSINFERLTKLIIQDLIDSRKESVLFKRYKKEDVIDALESPQSNETKIRNISNFLYLNSTHYKRLCNYFSKLLTYNYTISPYRVNIDKYNKKSFLLNYRKVADQVEKFNLKHILPNIFNICMYQDAFFGICFETSDSFDIAQISADYCKITSKEDGCLVFSLNFDYFKTRAYLLDNFGEEIKQMFLAYAGYTIESESGKNKKVPGDKKLQWQEPPNQICIKANEDQTNFLFPPFAGVFPEILNLEDYKLLKKTGQLLDKYKILSMKIPLNKETGVPLLPFDIAESFYKQALKNIDPSIGLIWSPMEIEKFDFQNSRTSESDAVNEAEAALWAATGSNGALFGQGEKLSSSSLNISIRNDESLVYSLLLQVEAWINRYIKSMRLPYSFKVKYLNQSIYNQKDIIDQFQKAATYGVAASRSLYAASLGISPSDVLNLGQLENDLGYADSWVPLKSSSTMSPSGDGGRPIKDNITDSTEAGRENDSNAERK